jgi:hypothetical protein
MKPAEIVILFALTLLMSEVALAEEQEVFRWVDSAGDTHYADRPPNSAFNDFEQVNIRTASVRPADGTSVPPDEGIEDTPAEAEDEAQRQEEEEKARAQAAAEKLERENNCAMAKDNDMRYTYSRRLYRTDASGERVYLNDTEADNMREQAQQDIAKWCK